MPSPRADQIHALVRQAALDASDCADRLYALQLALRGVSEMLPVEAAEAASLQRRATDLADALRDMDARRGWK